LLAKAKAILLSEMEGSYDWMRATDTYNSSSEEHPFRVLSPGFKSVASAAPAGCGAPVDMLYFGSPSRISYARGAPAGASVSLGSPSESEQATFPVNGREDDAVGDVKRQSCMRQVQCLQPCEASNLHSRFSKQPQQAHPPAAFPKWLAQSHVHQFAWRQGVG
jgi:hypothetical protein